MKLFGLLAGSALLAMSVTAQAEEAPTQGANAKGAGMEEMMLQMMKQQMAKTCSNKEMLACMEISESECSSMMDGVLNKCMAPKLGELMGAQGMSPEERAALNKEMESCAEGVSAEHGIDPEKAQSCSPKQQ